MSFRWHTVEHRLEEVVSVFGVLSIIVSFVEIHLESRDFVDVPSVSLLLLCLRHQSCALSRLASNHASLPAHLFILASLASSCQRHGPLFMLWRNISQYSSAVLIESYTLATSGILNFS
jgi:hypothetical protein